MPEPAKQRNENWSRDELILALDLYFKNRERLPDKNDPQVIQLSEFLRSLAAHTGFLSPTFRNPNGVYMKLGNFRALDPSYTKDGKRGLQAGGKGDKAVWDAFAETPEKLHETAQAVRGFMRQPANELAESEFEGAEAEEGRLLTRVHYARERSRELVRKKKQEALKKNGCLRCEACGFVYSASYGDHGKDFIEVHHLKPLHTLTPGSKTSLLDLALLCANCHRMLHARKPWLSLESIRKLIEENRGR